TKQVGVQVAIDAANKAFGAKQWAEAANAATAALRLDPSNRDMARVKTQAEARAAFDAGKAFEAKQNYGDAEAKYTEASSKSSTFTDAQTALGRVKQLLAAARTAEEAKRAAAQKAEEDRKNQQRLAILDAEQRKQQAQQAAQAAAANAKAADDAAEA